jgi:hypothetical protein
MQNVLFLTSDRGEGTPAYLATAGRRSGTLIIVVRVRARAHRAGSEAGRESPRGWAQELPERAGGISGVGLAVHTSHSWWAARVAAMWNRWRDSASVLNVAALASTITT